VATWKNDVTAQRSRSFTFGPFVLLPARQLLLRGEEAVRIGGRALDLLTALVERPGELLTKSELLARAWPDTTVDEGNLKVNMAVLRRALEEGPRTAQYIATVVGRGYRFVAPVQLLEPVEPPAVACVPVAPPHNLPLSTTRLFGRAEAIVAIRRDLDQARLVSIVGPGGVGKTTVAVAVAEQAVEAFTEGVWFVDLAPLKDAERAPYAIATALGIQAHSADMLSVVCEFLRGRQTLLVLDNCEHIIEGVAACADRILASAVGVRILVTSREPLLLAKERVRRLSGLDAPPEAARGLDAESALAFPAVQLFVERATDRHAAFRLSDADAPAVAKICRKLDGLALAIELAATRVDAFSASALLRQLDDRFRVLGGRRAGPERHRTLAATLDWSYGLLDESEAALLRAGSVFAGAFGLDGAAAVSARPSADVLDALASLSAKSLLVVEPAGEGVTCRLLETMRAYALGRLHGSGEEQLVRARHAEHVLSVLERAQVDWSRRRSADWGATYGPLVDDLGYALAWAGNDAAHRETLIRLTVAGTVLWNHLSLTEDCRKHVSRALGELDAAGLAGTATEMQLRMSLAGALMFTRGLVPEVLEALERTLLIAEELGDIDHRLRSLRLIGSYQGFVGEYQRATATLEEFAALAREHDPSALPDSETHLGINEIFSGRLERARERLERLHHRGALASEDSRLARFVYDRNVDVGGVLAYAQWLTGSPDTAAQTAEATVAYGLGTKHWLSLSNALAVAACPVSFMSGRFEECARYLSLLEEQVRQHGIVIWAPTARFYQGALACAKEHPSAEGVAELTRAVEEFRAINHWARMSWILAVLADALARSGRLAEATSTIEEAMRWGHAHNERWCMPEVLRIRATIFNLQGCRDRAESDLLDSLAMARDMKGLSWQLRSATELAHLLRSRSRFEEAREVLLSAFSAFTEGFTTRDLVVAAGLLEAEPPTLPRKREQKSLPTPDLLRVRDEKSESKARQ
jgi:predicted ATPase